MNISPPNILRLATSRSLGLCALFASILIFSGSASAELRILSWGESSSDSQLGGNYREKVPITENDQTYTANIETGEEYTRATTKISDEGIEQDVEFSWGLQFPENKWASSNVTIIFELTEPMYYDFSGEALFNDPYGSVTTFQATLGLGPSWEPFSNIQLSRGSIKPEKYVLGEQRGTHENTLDGASRGVLYAGMYFLRLYTSSSDYSDGDGNEIVGDQMNENYQGPITCSSKIKLNFRPIPVDAKPVIDVDPIYYSLANEEITINASPIEGYPEFEFEFEWYFNGELIEQDRTKNPAFLTIDGTQDSVGEYRVVVYSNFETKTEKTFDYRNSPGPVGDLDSLTYATVDGKVTIIDCDEGATGHLVIPDTIEGNPVSSIGKRAFDSCVGLTSITIPDGVTSIGDYAFVICSASTSITIPDSVTSIGVGTFGQCTSLTSITIPDGVTSIGDWTFSGCSASTSITIPDSVTSIGFQAFFGCTSLTSISIPDSVTSIGDYAFNSCSSLSTITFLGSAPTVGASIFTNVANGASAIISGEKKASFGGIGTDWNGLTLTCLDGALCWLTWTTTGGEVTITDCDEAASGELMIPDTIEGNPVTSIGKSAFSQCKSLTSITIPDGVTSIGLQAFFHCDGLTSITIPNSVTSIGVQAFVICTNLTSITIPDGVTSIGASAFSQCTSLTSITIPESVTSIGAEAFNRCTSLTSITIPDSVISVGFGTFSQCTSLTNIAIPDSVTSIGDYAFGTCTSLTSITIPDSVTSIGEFAFVDCISLMEVVLEGPAPAVQSNAFTSTADGAIAFAKTEFVESYGGDGASWEGLTVREISSPPLLNLESFYESAPSQSLEIDALNFPTNYSTTTYQWFFNGFPIPEKFGGNSPKITIDGLTSSNGSWSVTATNFLGESTATFEYRVFIDTDSDGFSDYREQNLTGTNFELADTDSDGLNDYQELIVFETDPTDSDSDDDGYLDGQEQGEGTDPNQAESYPQRTLTVPTVENGSVSGGGSYALGVTATLTATPATGYVFISWNSAIKNPLTITMDTNQSISAIFGPDTRDPDGDGLSNYQELVLFKTDPADSDSDDDGYPDGQEQIERTDPNEAESYPQRTLTVPTVENGSVSGGGSYALGVTATLTATPAIGYVFTSWSGGSTATDNPLTITMDDEQSVGAIFSQDTRDPDEDGLSNYQELVLFNTDPTDSDSDDDGYLDGQEQTEGTDPNEAESYPQRALTVPTVENGSVSGGGSYALGVTATLTATPAIGYVFTSWSGGSTATDNPLTITMDDEQSVGAIFSQDTRDPDEDGLSNYQELVLFKTDPADSDSDDDGFSDGQEQGEGTDPNEAESFPTRVLTINDSANGTFTGGGVYQLGVTATLQAIPDTGYLFGGWVGEVIGESNPLSITMLVNQSVGANFEQDTRDSDEDGLSNYQELVVFNTDPTDSDSDDDGYLDGQEQTEGTDPNESNSYPTRSLATERVNNGSISGSGTYALGEEVVVTANPDPGFIFSWWSGNASGSVNPLAVIMTSNLSIGAAFVPDNRDNDGDGLSNFSELKIHNTDPNKFDSDGDGFSDGLEISERTNPNVSSLFPTRTIGISDSANGFVEGGGTYPLGVTIEVTATPSAGYLFFKWVGDVDGTENPLSLKISSNLNLEAIFQQDERDSDLDGLSNYQEIIVYNTDPNNPDSDGDGFNDGLEISEETNPNISSVFPTRSLLVVAPLNGSVNSQAIYPLDAIATLTATPEPGYVFYSWAGDTISSQNPLPVEMSENRILSAIFNQDERDSDGDGLSNYDEIVIHATNPNQMDTDEDGFDDDEEILKGTDPNDSQAFPERKPIELRIEKLNVPSLVIFAYWTGEVGKTYRIEYAADFQNWNILDSGIKGTGLEQSRALPGPKGYVRVLEE
ncbi:leucine-rich repeat protein [Akkermansiaceae bacterium]|nr:leucine-rich repeat protein [Akkermansiaceae bacterium]